MKSFARSPKNDHVPSLPEQMGMILIGVFAGGLAMAFHAVINLAEKTANNWQFWPIPTAWRQKSGSCWPAGCWPQRPWGWCG